MCMSRIFEMWRGKSVVKRHVCVRKKKDQNYTSRIWMCKGKAIHCVTRRYTKLFGFTLLFASSPIGPIFCVVLFFVGRFTVRKQFFFSCLLLVFSLAGIVLLCAKYFIWRDNLCMNLFLYEKEYWAFIKRWCDWIVSIWTVRFWFELFTIYCVICLLSDIIRVQINLDAKILLSRKLEKDISRRWRTPTNTFSCCVVQHFSET